MQGVSGQGNPTKIISTSWSGAYSKEDSSCFETIGGSLRLTNQIRTSNDEGVMRWCPMLVKLCLGNSLTTSDVANKDNNVLHLMLRACKAEL
nr:hypothetical protein CFP56_65330 [Quercus suber]